MHRIKIVGVKTLDFRFTDKEIKQSAKECINKIQVLSRENL